MSAIHLANLMTEDFTYSGETKNFYKFDAPVRSASIGTIYVSRHYLQEGRRAETLVFRAVRAGESKNYAKFVEHRDLNDDQRPICEYPIRVNINAAGNAPDATVELKISYGGINGDPDMVTVRLVGDPVGGASVYGRHLVSQGS